MGRFSCTKSYVKQGMNFYNSDGQLRAWGGSILDSYNFNVSRDDTEGRRL